MGFGLTRVKSRAYQKQDALNEACYLQQYISTFYDSLRAPV
jgi:hypothetical protein